MIDGTDICIPAAAHGQPRSAMSHIERVCVEGELRVAEVFPNTTEGHAALMLVAIQQGPRQAKHMRNMLARIKVQE